MREITAKDDIFIKIIENSVDPTMLEVAFIFTWEISRIVSSFVVGHGAHV